jgi:hypothetical protein
MTNENDLTRNDDTMAAAEQLDELRNNYAAELTTASALGADAETAWVPADPATVDQYAWSEGDEIAVDLSHPWTRVLAIAAGLLVIGTVAAVAVATMWQAIDDSKGSGPTFTSATTRPVVAAPPSTTAPPVTTDPPQGPLWAAPPIVVTTIPASPTVTVREWGPPATAALDDRYIGELTEARLGPSDRSAAIRDAHSFCSRVASGQTASSVAADLQSAHPTLAAWDAGLIVNTAIDIYCPELGN